MTRREQAQQYAIMLTGDVYARRPLTFQTFPDGDGESGAAPAIIHAPLSEAWERLLDLQEYGHGVFVMVNEGDGRGRSSSHVVRVRALFADDDHGTVKVGRLQVQPSMVVASGNGAHFYWLVSDGDLATFTDAQKRIAARLGTDPRVCDPARVLRLPGTDNLKDRSHPAPVLLLLNRPDRLYTCAEVLDGLGAAPLAAAPPVELPPSPPSRVLSGNAKERAQAYISTIVAVEGQGGDAATYRAAVALRDFGLSRDDAWDALRTWNQTNASPPWTEKDLGKKFMHAQRYGKAPIGAKLADKIAGVDEQLAAVEQQATTDPRLDPANYCYDPSQRGRPWRRYHDGQWLDGISNSDLERVLENEGGLGARAIKAWQKKVAVVERAEPVYTSNEKIAKVGGVKVANTYRRPCLVPTSYHGPEPLDPTWLSIELVLRNLVSQDVESYKYVIGWLGKLAQNAYRGTPARIGTALVFRGPKGAGKGVLEEVVKALLGPWNVASVAQGDLDSAHMAWIVGKLAVCADEVFTTESRAPAQIAKLKNMITAHRRLINPKGKDQVWRDAVDNWLLWSNAFRPVEIERGDRRFSVFETGKPIDPDLGARVADDARADGPMVRAFLGYLLSLPQEALVKDYRVLETTAKQQVARASGNSATKFAMDVAARGFWSVTAAWEAGQIERGWRNLYLHSADGLRRIERPDVSPVLLVRKLMEVYRAYAQEIGAPAQQESTVLAALREELPDLYEGELAVDGRRERVVAGLPHPLPDHVTVVLAPPESPLPLQRSLSI